MKGLQNVLENVQTHEQMLNLYRTFKGEWVESWPLYHYIIRFEAMSHLINNKCWQRADYNCNKVLMLQMYCQINFC